MAAVQRELARLADRLPQHHGRTGRLEHGKPVRQRRFCVAVL